MSSTGMEIVLDDGAFAGAVRVVNAGPDGHPPHQVVLCDDGAGSDTGRPHGRMHTYELLPARDEAGRPRYALLGRSRHRSDARRPAS